MDTLGIVLIDLFFFERNTHQNIKSRKRAGKNLQIKSSSTLSVIPKEHLWDPAARPISAQSAQRHITTTVFQ